VDRRLVRGTSGGLSWTDVPDSYLDWIISTAVGFDENVVHTAKAVRANRRAIQPSALGGAPPEAALEWFFSRIGNQQSVNLLWQITFGHWLKAIEAG
jgi:hypothetical protein